MNLAELLNPIAPQTFAEEYWEKRPLLLHGDPCRFKGIFSSSDMGRLLQYQRPRSPEGIMLVKGSRHCDINWIYPDGSPRLDKVREAFRDGYTVVVNKLESLWEPVALFTGALEQELHHPIHVNLYYTPAGTQGFEAHYDVMDVFILQLEGTKVWEIREPGADLPLPDEHAALNKDRMPPVVFEEELRPGTVLYLPRGQVHSARTNTTASLHLTVGMNVVTWIDLFSAAISAARKDARFKRSLPPGFFGEPDGMREQFETLVDEMKNNLRMDDGLSALAAQLIVPKPAPGQAMLPEEPGLDADTTVTRRTGVICRAIEGPGYAGIHYSGGRMVGPGKIADGLKFVAENATFRIGALPGNLTEKEKLVLARRLVKDGLLKVRNGSE